MKRRIDSRVALLLLLAIACDDHDSSGQIKNPVAISFSGTVTRVVFTGDVTPPPGLERGTHVSGTVSYLPTTARALVIRSSEVDYTFYSQDQNRVLVTLGSTQWSLMLGVVSICNEACEGDEVAVTSVGAPPLVTLSYSDLTLPYELVRGVDLPTSAQASDFAAASSARGTISSGTADGVWNCEFSLDSTSMRELAALREEPRGAANGLP